MCPFLLPVLLNKWVPGHLLGKKFLDLGDSAKLTGHRCGSAWLLSSDRLTFTKVPGSHTIPEGLPHIGDQGLDVLDQGRQCEINSFSATVACVNTYVFVHFQQVLPFFRALTMQTVMYMHFLVPHFWTTMRGRWLYCPVFHLRKLKG